MDQVVEVLRPFFISLKRTIDGESGLPIKLNQYKYVFGDISVIWWCQPDDFLNDKLDYADITLFWQYVSRQL